MYAQTVIIPFQRRLCKETKLEYFIKAAARDLSHRLRWTIRNPLRRDPLTSNTEKVISVVFEFTFVATETKRRKTK